MAIGFRKRHEVRLRIQRRFGKPAAAVKLLPDRHHAEVSVIEDHDFRRKTVTLAGDQLLNAHLDRPIAREADDRFIRERDRGADRGGQSKAHRALTAARQKMSGLVELQVLGGVHLMFAHIRCIDRVCGGCGLNLFHQRFRHDRLAVSRIVKRLPRPPLVNLVPPGREELGVLPVVLFFKKAHHVSEHRLHVAHDGDLSLHAFRNR